MDQVIRWTHDRSRLVIGQDPRTGNPVLGASTRTGIERLDKPILQDVTLIRQLDKEDIRNIRLALGASEDKILYISVYRMKS